MSNHGDNKATATTTVSISGLLGIAFVVLRLCGVIDWSWWAVTAPFWAPVAIFVIIFLIGFAYYYIKYDE